MIEPCFFYKLLEERGTDFFTGVPDSLLKSFCAWVTEHTTQSNHVQAVNEGAAVALAAGYYLATGKIPIVYMQNSGIGNAVNPLLSLADGDVYRIPIILLIGWRGEPGVKDEPQHITQGKVTCSLFGAMGIPYRILSGDEKEAQNQIEECCAHINANNTPFALIVRKDIFAPYVSGGDNACFANTDVRGNDTQHGLSDDTLGNEYEMSREEAIEEIIRSSLPDEIFIATTGMASRELYELREKYGMGHERDFLTVGSMGHASSLALSIALQKPNRLVTCIDGDGAALMHMGSMATIGARRPVNLRHIVLNNGAHDSVGGQPTIARQINLAGIAKSCGYAAAYSVKTIEELRRTLNEASNNGPVFIEVLIRKGSRKDLGRPKSSPQENKEMFMHFIAEGNNNE